MKLVATKAWILWGALADGKRQHVRDLAQLIGCDAHALYGQWKQLPSEIQKQLRQHDGWWQLKQAMAVVSPVQATAISDSSGFQVDVLPETTSTNDVLWQRWHEGQDIHKHMVCALEQSQGRGRLQRPWQNVPGQTLMFSLAYHIAHGSAALAALPLVVGLVVQQTLAEQQVHSQLKWPNDIVVGARKLCGILVESKQRGERWHVVIGIGVNVMPPQQEALRDLATACNAQTADFSCASFLAQLLPQLDQALQVFFKQGFEAFQAAYAAQMRDVNQPVQLFERGKLIGQGTAVGVTEVGSLRVVDEAGQEQVYLNGENITSRLRNEEVGNMASKTSAYKTVRATLLDLQRDLAKTANILMDGRDIGTNVLPNADLKIYLTASSKVRAERRYKELVEKGVEADFDKIEEDIIIRDRQDMEREIAPLKQAEDAVLVDSSDMTIEEVVDAIVAEFEKVK